jgi:hypothetical protein
MPIHSLSPPFSDFRGSISDPSGNNSLTLTKLKHAGFTSHSYFAPRNPSAAAQAKTRAFFAEIATSYRSLALADVESWAETAASIAKTDTLKQPSTFSPYNLFQSVNWHRLNFGLEITTQPPPISPAPPPVESVTLAAADPTSLFVHLETPALENVGFLYLRVTKASPRPSRRSYPRDARQVDPIGRHHYSVYDSPDERFHIRYPNHAPLPGAFIGLLIAGLRLDFLPGEPPQFFANIQVTEPET